MTPARSRMFMCTAWAVLLFAVASAGSAAPPPAEAFASLPAISDVNLSPNGNLLAWADRSGSDEVVVIFDLAAGRIRHQISIGKELKLRDIDWADDDMVLVQLSQTEKLGAPSLDRFRYEFFRTLAIDVNLGRGHVLLMADGARQLVTGSTLEAFRTAKPHTVVMSTLDYSIAAERAEIGTRLAGRRGDSGWVATLFDVDTTTGKGRAVETGSQFTDQWVVDAEGRCVARSEWKPAAKSYRILAKKGAGWDEIYARTDGVTLDLSGVTADGTAIVATGPNGAGRRVVYSIALNGSGNQVLFEDPTYDVGGIIEDRFDGTPVGVWLGGPAQEARWFDRKAQARYESVARAFKGSSVAVYGRSQDGHRVLARVDSPSRPAVYYLVDFTKHSADIVGDEYPGLAQAALGEVRAISYKARDGTPIPAYITLPPGVAERTLPLVVLPHGGPESRDAFAFDWWAQFLATRGYLVLQPQFRGSTGFGDAFRLAGYGQWGRLMQDDVTDGVRAMIEQGLADPKRVCIVGASYGGYTALAGAAFTPDLYRCAISVSGVSDLPAMLGAKRAQAGDESDVIAYWHESIGSPFDKNVIERSPARAADRVHIPILLIHGLDDTVVPVEQSEMMARALDKSHGRYAFVRLKGEDHWMSRAETRLQVMKEIEKFLAANL